MSLIRTFASHTKSRRSYGSGDYIQSAKQDGYASWPIGYEDFIFRITPGASSAFQQLFNSIDVAVVGRFASSEALAAVGSNAPVISLLINLFLGISMGANAVISNHIGQNNG